MQVHGLQESSVIQNFHVTEESAIVAHIFLCDRQFCRKSHAIWIILLLLDIKRMPHCSVVAKKDGPSASDGLLNLYTPAWYDRKDHLRESLMRCEAIANHSVTTAHTANECAS